jgi:hypothetical protein
VATDEESADVDEALLDIVLDRLLEALLTLDIDEFD